MRKSLREKAINALSWSFLESIGVLTVRFVIGIVLARLLLPEQFGLIGMLWVFIAVAQSFADSGFGIALIQKPDLTHTDIHSIFYFNIAVGIVATGVVVLIAPWIALFYKQPALTALTRAMSIVILISSLSIVHLNLLDKTLARDKLAKVSLLDVLLSGAIGVAMAVKGFGVWSLVAQQIVGTVVRTISLWFMNPWRPALVFSVHSLRRMLGFGSRMLASGLLEQLFNNLYVLIIGRLFSAVDVGHFTRAKAFQELPTNMLSGLVGRITFPVFSTIQDDADRLKKGVKKALSFLALVNFPMMIGLAVTAEPLVLALLTEKWAPCIPYLQVLCFYGLLYPMQRIHMHLLMATGHARLFFRVEVIKKLLIVVSIALSWRWGIEGMIYGMIAAAMICYLIHGWLSVRVIGYSAREQARDIFPYLGVAALMGIAVHAIQAMPLGSAWSKLLAGGAVGVVIYMTLCRLLKLETFMEVVEEVRRRLA